jgi:hypothetical protein
VANTVGPTLARKMNRVADELRRANETAIRAAALSMTTEVRKSIEAVAPGGKLRGVGTKGGRVGARFDMQGADKAVIKPTGAIALIEEDTKAHQIQPKGAGPRSRGSGKKAVSFNGMAFASVQHPGTKGKHPFAKGIEAGKPAAIRTVQTATSDAMKRGIRA